MRKKMNVKNEKVQETMQAHTEWTPEELAKEAKRQMRIILKGAAQNQTDAGFGAPRHHYYR